jgi:hypothetical protein
LPRKEWKDGIDLRPEVTYVDVGTYLLFAPSPYTHEELRNYKSMQSYQRFIAGWVREILVKDIGDKRVVISKVCLYIHCLASFNYLFKVNHSQRLREKALLPWVICEESGKMAGHSNCMAGMRESCSHVASLLWAIEAGIRLRCSLTVTPQKVYWVSPPVVKDVPYAKISETNFQGKESFASMEYTHSISSLAFIPFFIAWFPHNKCSASYS